MSHASHVSLSSSAELKVATVTIERSSALNIFSKRSSAWNILSERPPASNIPGERSSALNILCERSLALNMPSERSSALICVELHGAVPGAWCCAHGAVSCVVAHVARLRTFPSVARLAQASGLAKLCLRFGWHTRWHPIHAAWRAMWLQKAQWNLQRPQPTSSLQRRFAQRMPRRTSQQPFNERRSRRKA